VTVLAKDTAGNPITAGVKIVTKGSASTTTVPLDGASTTTTLPGAGASTTTTLPLDTTTTLPSDPQ
jgi:hypothetical protein